MGRHDFFHNLRVLNPILASAKRYGGSMWVKIARFHGNFAKFWQFPWKRVIFTHMDLPYLLADTRIGFGTLKL